MTDVFNGFPEELFQFLRALSRNNNRDWFAENKESYRASVMHPVSDFIIAMAPRLAKLSPHFVADPRANGGSMFRIYRDTRFSKNKLPYKTHVGCQFRHEAGKDAHAPGFYVHLEPDRIFFGAGLWNPAGDALARIRDAIVERPEAWQAIVEGTPFVQRFGGLTGDSLKRPPRGYAADHPLIDDLKRKSFVVMQYEDESLAKGPDLMDEIEHSFGEASAFMRFLTRAQGLPY